MVWSLSERKREREREREREGGRERERESKAILYNNMMHLNTRTINHFLLCLFFKLILCFCVKHGILKLFDFSKYYYYSLHWEDIWSFIIFFILIVIYSRNLFSKQEICWIFLIMLKTSDYNKCLVYPIWLTLNYFIKKNIHALLWQKIVYSLSIWRLHIETSTIKNYLLYLEQKLLSLYCFNVLLDHHFLDKNEL